MAKQPAGKSFLATLYHARQLADKGVAPVDPEFEAKFPGLWQLLTDQWIDPKHKTEAGQLVVWNSAGDWCFKASSTGLRAAKTVMVPTFELGLAKLEKALFDEAIPWQFWLKRQAKIREVKDQRNGLAGGG